MTLEITSIVNGWTLFYDDGEPRIAVIECADPDTFAENAHRAGDAQRLLWSIIEILGLGGDRYDAARVCVVLEPGDKYEGKS